MSPHLLRLLPAPFTSAEPPTLSCIQGNGIGTNMHPLHPVVTSLHSPMHCWLELPAITLLGRANKSVCASYPYPQQLLQVLLPLTCGVQRPVKPLSTSSWQIGVSPPCTTGSCMIYPWVCLCAMWGDVNSESHAMGRGQHTSPPLSLGLHNPPPMSSPPPATLHKPRAQDKQHTLTPVPRMRWHQGWHM